MQFYMSMRYGIKIMSKNFENLILFFLFYILCIASTFGQEDMNNYKLQVAARALVVKEDKLLLVSNEGMFWYTPGGRQNANETLPECVVREVKEETGINVHADEIISVFDFFDKKNAIHKVEVYFATKIKSDIIPTTWQDEDGPVKFVKFFSQKELQNMDNIAPNFLKNINWLKTSTRKIYEGYEVK